MVPLDMTNGENKEDLHTLAQAMTTQVNRYTGPRMNALKSTMTSRLRNLMRMNLPTFLLSKEGEDLQEFLDGVYKLLSAMGVNFREKAELASSN